MAASRRGVRPPGSVEGPGEKKGREDRGLFWDHREALAVLSAATLAATLSNVRILVLTPRRPAALLATTTTLPATLTALTTLLPTLTALLLAIALPGVTRVRASHVSLQCKGPQRLWRTAFANVALAGPGSHPSRG